MRNVGRFVFVVAFVALPLIASAQAGEEALPKVALAIHTQHRLPPQLMLRASYYLYLDADEKGRSRVERWHPEAFVDPSEPNAEEPKSAQADGEVATSGSNLEESVSSPAPGTAVPDIDTLSQRAIEHHEIHYKTPNEGSKKPNRRRRRAIALGVTIPILVVGTAVLIGGAVAVSNREF
jgi:hypothetical protein